MDKIMEEYNKSHIEESENIYMSDDEMTENKSNLANKLYSNYDNMNNTERGEILLKCINPSGIIRELTKFELKHYNPESIIDMNKDEFIKRFNKLLKRYQHKAGGIYIEDGEWELYEDDFRDIELKNNELYFENSIARCNMNNNNTINFLKRITRILNKIATNISVKYKLDESKKDDITWIHIIATFDKNINENIEIGL